jgi:hypothetical protein
MSINVAILRKEGPLDEDERFEMMRHPEYGFQILSASDRLQMAAEIALNHHEQWDGGGYPAGRKGEEIPASARIVTLADISPTNQASPTTRRGRSSSRATTASTPVATSTRSSSKSSPSTTPAWPKSGIRCQVSGSSRPA